MKRTLETTQNNGGLKLQKMITFGVNFRKRLKTDKAINALKEFVLASKERDVVSEYLDSGGSAKELLSLLKLFDGKKDFIVASTVFSALHCVIVKSVDELLLIQKNVEQVCEELLCTYQITIQNMLSSSSSSASYRKIVLKLLSGMVLLSVGLARKILTLFPMNGKLLKILTDSRSSRTAMKLRTCFINFLLSFLNDENVVLISELLKKKGMLMSIVPGLMNDRPETVISVLNTFQLKIVENVKISKTLKIHTFNTPVLRSLFKLYDYQVINESEEDNGIRADSSYSANLAQSVHEAAHSLLLLLCTSLKKGALFRDRNVGSGKSPNHLILTLLEEVTAPWKNELKSQLVTEILKVCPEFLKTVFNQLESYLQPSNTEDWCKLIKFLKEIVNKQKIQSEIINEQSMFVHVTSSFFPIALQKLFSNYCDEVLHQNPSVRFQILSLLEVCLKKILTWLEHCIPLATCHSTVEEFKDYVEQFVHKNSVSCITLVNLWNIDLTVDNHEPHFNVLEYYHTLANVLLFYSKLCPITFSQLRINENFNLKEIDISDSELKFKRAQLMYLIVNPKPNHEQFPSLFRLFIGSYIQDRGRIEDRVLEDMFLATGFFEGFEKEIQIWMYCIRRSSIEYSCAISDFLVDVFSTTAQQYKKFMNNLMQVSCENEALPHENADLPINLECFIDADGEYEHISKPYVLISPVIPALLTVMKTYEECDENNQSDILRPFVLRILVHLLHLQSDTAGLIALLEKYPSSYIDLSFLEYIRFWSQDKVKPNDFLYPLSDEKKAAKLSVLLIKAKPSSEIPSLLSDVSQTECILLWNMCMHYSLHLCNKHFLQNERYDVIKNAFSALRDKLSPENRTECLKFVVTDLNFINSFNFSSSRKQSSLFVLLLDIFLDFQRHNSLPSNYSKLLAPYRQRLILFLLKRREQNEIIHVRFGSYSICDVVRFTVFNGRTTALLLNTFSSLTTDLLVVQTGAELSEWCAVIQCLLDIAAKEMENPMETESLLSLLSKIPEFLQLNVNVNSLEMCIVEYLRSFPHHIPKIPEDFLSKIIEYHPTVDKLAVHLVSFHAGHGSALLRKIERCSQSIDVNEHFEIAKKIGPLYSSSILEIVKTHHFPQLITWIEGDVMWETDYADFVVKIFQTFCDEKLSRHLCKQIEKKWSKVVLNAGTSLVINAIFENAGQKAKLINLLISRLVSMLSSTYQNVNWLCSALCDVVETEQNLNFLLINDEWSDFIKLGLKVSLQTSNSTLMRTLRIICHKALVADSSVETNTIFQMTISHSEFVNIVLKYNSEIKCEVIKFYLLLTKKNESIMSTNHIPLLLSAYNATLSESDQLLLQVLQCYEINKIRFSDCKPYLWGEAAATHHSIRTEISVSLKRQPQPNQVLELLDIDIVRNTIRHAPLSRTLQPQEEKYPVDVEVYDLSFMLPLMSHLLAPESRISVQKFTRSGAFALVLVCLSSQESDVRVAAFHCLQRFHSHLNSREKEIQIWNHFMTALKNGIIAAKLERSDVDMSPRLACIVTHFLAHMSLIISEPLHSLYVPLTNFLLAKASFDVNIIPNFLALFYSADMKNRDHQEWLLKIIRDGMRCELDWVVAHRCFSFKLLLQYYSSTASNDSIDTLILEILCNALRIPSCRINLISKCGLLSWLGQYIQNCADINKNSLLCLVNIFQSLQGFKKGNSLIFTILLLLRKLHAKNLDHHYVEKMLEVLTTMYLRQKVNVLSKRNCQFIIDFAARYQSAKCHRICQNCLNYSSVVGVEECYDNISNYVIRIIRKLVMKYS